ncbi:MAG TPA: ribonuclease HII [Longimicrobiales bacterium]|nr:ribonuclease HII [Longimicrobiales bacterium]
MAQARKRRKRRRGAPLTIERELWADGLELVAGVDEAGRGPLAGPVVAAAVIFRPEVRVPGVTDSKVLSPEVREELVVEIRRRALAIGVGAATSREVDRLNILRASHLAMKRAIGRLDPLPEHVLVDGLPVPELGPGHTSVVGGDSKSYTIACASIVAKTVRDRIMRLLSCRYPGYGWETNAGYGTREHVTALDDLGPTPHHRRSFVPVQLSLELQG